ncbi:hypothetical protein [Methylobacterium sp. A54F]
MTDPQRRAIRNDRARLGARGLAGFEVLGRETDRDLTRPHNEGRPVDL